MSTITAVSHQWASRPPDQRFTSLLDLHAHTVHTRENSRARCVSSRMIECQPLAQDSRSLVAVGPDGGQVNVTNWAFGQLAQRAGAPAGYLRSLPAPMAADCINYGMRVQRDVEDLGVLLYRNGGAPELRAVTGPNYGRVWNATITNALVERFGDGLTGDFRVPGEFGKAVPVTTQNTTLYASDRDMFVFLADEEHRIEVPARRDGKPGALARGFIVWNSETGAQTLGIATMLFDYVCQNRIIWGVDGYQEVRIRHTSSAPDRWLEDVAPALTAYATSSTVSLTRAITDARARRVENVDDFLAKRFTRSQVGAIKAAHMTDEQRPIESLWDAANGVTAYARSIGYQDERVKLEREAGKILNLV
ncbi:MAG: hypothetical protein ACYDBH_00610 [Acidobacteriaceae bacterium]